MNRLGYLTVATLAACSLPHVYLSNSAHPDADPLVNGLAKNGQVELNFSKSGISLSNDTNSQITQNTLNRIEVYKKIYDKHFGFQNITVFCPKSEFDFINRVGGGSSSAWHSTICLPFKDEKMYADIFMKRRFVDEAVDKVDFLKKFKKEYQNGYDSNVTEMDKKLAIDYVIAHELSHLYSHKFINKAKQNKITSGFKFKGMENSSTSNTFHDLHDEILADMISLTALKEVYGNTNELKSFVKKLGFNKMTVSTRAYEVGDMHFTGMYFKDGVDATLAYSFKPQDLTRLVMKSEELARQSFNYLNPIKNEKEIQASYDFIQKELQCHTRTKTKDACYRTYNLDERISKMSYPAYKQEYEAEFKKMTGFKF